MKKFLGIIMVFIALMGCQNSLSLQVIETETDVVEEYVKSIITLYEQDIMVDIPEQGVVNLVADYLDAVVIEKDGVQVVFSELSAEDQAQFLAVWQEKEIAQLTARCEEDPSFKIVLKAKSASIAEAMKASKSVSSLSFVDAYSAAYQNKQDSINAAVSAAMEEQGDAKGSGGGLWALRKYYRRGRILYVKDKSSSSDFLNFGHCSLMSESLTWNYAWEQDPYNSYLTTSAWGNDKYQYIGYEGQEVGHETVAYWLNMVSKVPVPQFKIYKVGKDVWVWDWFKSHWEWRNASDSDASKAVNYAKSKIGLPYNFNFVWKYAEDTFYCSQLVWRAWNKANGDYKLDWGATDTWVTPDDVIGSSNAKHVVTASN